MDKCKKSSHTRGSWCSFLFVFPFFFQSGALLFATSWSKNLYLAEIWSQILSFALFIDFFHGSHRFFLDFSMIFIEFFPVLAVFSVVFILYPRASIFPKFSLSFPWFQLIFPWFQFQSIFPCATCTWRTCRIYRLNHNRVGSK